MPMYENNDGRTAAMWTGTTIVTLGFLVATVALTIAQPWLFWVGVILIPVGAIVGKAMAMAGMGQPIKDSRSESGDSATTSEPAADSSSA